MHRPTPYTGSITHLYSRANILYPYVHKRVTTFPRKLHPPTLHPLPLHPLTALSFVSNHILFINMLFLTCLLSIPIHRRHRPRESHLTTPNAAAAATPLLRHPRHPVSPPHHVHVQPPPRRLPPPPPPPPPPLPKPSAWDPVVAIRPPRRRRPPLGRTLVSPARTSTASRTPAPPWTTSSIWSSMRSLPRTETPNRTPTSHPPRRPTAMSLFKYWGRMPLPWSPRGPPSRACR